ncbi:transglutaminase-like enzyme, putative cysteine protease [Rubidibacter lacunae KORDI 51-2]|uniref:Transglutaminase-like enzyme, putative cysteine protease n=1 Tax=Rubidibacter lacunae KORDI 51-2 TaxID=582515 RepID=U5DPT0_9CHRO|nr:transglutaminase family protein [Rubidibacter lacunae]ERN42877.1 transglutaminase-like enzyme, putative cysteine protease [Rubidibacter lacunae KORDI 51-2]
MLHLTSPVSTSSSQTIRPFAAASLYGIAQRGRHLLAIDARTGYLFEIDPIDGSMRVLNTHNATDFLDTTGIAIAGNTLWFTQHESVCFCSLEGDLKPQLFTTLPYAADGITVWETAIYVSCNGTDSIHVFSSNTRKEITRLLAPGIGREHLTIRGEELWVSDRTEQTVFCLDRATGEIDFSVLTPFPCPTGLAFFTDPNTGREQLYVAYTFEEPFIRDNPNATPNHEIQYRDAAFIHPLYVCYEPERRYTRSNGFLVEMSYVEEIAPLDAIDLTDLEWRIALPAETHRQKLHSVEPIGIPFAEEIIDGQRVAVFNIERLTTNDRFVFGWKALLEVWSIKYQFEPRDGDRVPELDPELRNRYTLDDDELAMDTDIIRRAAVDAPGDETNLLRRMYNIRNFVYDKLAYGIKPQIDPPDVVIRRGVASCGEYLGLLLAIARLNGIASRTVGRYKCPQQPHARNVPLEPDFNHVWMEFYLPGWGWLPMESNPDDINEGGPYPTRFFMGLAWYHAEMAKGIPFETICSRGERLTKEVVAIGELAINHVRFVVLDELIPNPEPK